MRETIVLEAATKNNKAVLNLTMIALFVSFTAVCAQISIPLPFTPVPRNLALIMVFMSGYIMGSAKGAISPIIYVLLGCVGAPVFAGFQGGLGIIIGSTGGYVVGYIAASFIVGLFVKNKRGAITVGLSMTSGLIACYFSGTLWFMISTKTNLLDALLMCVIPFLFGDILKIFLSVILSQRIKEMFSNRKGYIKKKSKNIKR